MSELVFVYGTLKRGNGNHRQFLLKNGKFIGPGHTLIGFEMWSYGFPRIAPSRGGYQVVGEMYIVESLEALDVLEGVPQHYQRKRTEVYVNGKIYKPWIYVQKNDHEWAWQMAQFGVRPANGMLEWKP